MMMVLLDGRMPPTLTSWKFPNPSSQVLDVNIYTWMLPGYLKLIVFKNKLIWPSASGNTTFLQPLTLVRLGFTPPPKSFITLNPTANQVLIDSSSWICIKSDFPLQSFCLTQFWVSINCSSSFFNSWYLRTESIFYSSLYPQDIADSSLVSKPNEEVFI